MSVNDENSAGAANNNNCSKVTDLEHYEAASDLARSMWPPCPPPPPPPNAGGWIGTPTDLNSTDNPTYTPLVKVGSLIVFSACLLPPCAGGHAAVAQCRIDDPPAPTDGSRQIPDKNRNQILSNSRPQQELKMFLSCV